MKVKNNVYRRFDLHSKRFDNQKVSNELYEYILDLISESRKLNNGGLSTRAAIAVINASKACAYVQGEDHVTPDHVHLSFHCC